jgi:hypothetical protein
MSYGNKVYQVTAIGQLVKAVSELLAKDASTYVSLLPTLQDSRIGMNNLGGSEHRRQRGSIALVFLENFRQRIGNI